MADTGLDFLGGCLDEIAIEGLDGITLSALWLRLMNRPHFPLALDEKSKEFIWNCIAVHEELSFYELPEIRPPLVLLNRYDNVDMDLGIVIEPETPPLDIYPFCIVDENGERGSCKTYHTRKNITSVIKDSFDLKLSLSEVTEKWGEQLVLVASQSARNLALMGTEVNPLLELNAIQYCILERIARSRYHGEVTQGRLGLGVMIENVKSLNYYRTILARKHLITKQVYYQKNSNGQTASGSLLHLTRFYVERRSKMHVMMQRICEVLASKPNQREIFQKLRIQLGMKESGYKKLFQKPFQQCVKTYSVPYSEMYPNATKQESHNANGKEKLIKVIQLIKPYHEEEEEYDEEEEETNMCHLKVFDPRNFVMDRPLLSQTYKIIELAGPEGVSSQELGKKMVLPKLDIRLLLRNLEKRGVIMAIMQDMGRQRVSKYISKHLENRSEVCQKLLEESRRILECHTNNAEKKVGNDTDKSSQNANVLNNMQDVQSVIVSSKDDKPASKKTGNGRSFTEDVKYMHNSNRKDVAHITYRMLKRANIIIEAVKNAKLVEDIFKLKRMILESEKEEGYSEKLDKKSLLRLLNKLTKDGYIKSLKTVLKFGNQEKKLHFLCDPNLSVDDPLIKGAIEQAKFKYFAVSKEQMKKPQVDKSISQSVRTLRDLYKKKTQQAHMEYMPSIGRVYGLEPKFLRMKALHTFLFYLVYDYQGIIPKPIESNELPIYHNSKTWKMFVPPLPKHSGIESGWCLISDILLCMPLSLLVKIVNITYKIDGLEEYLGDSVKRHYLIRHIPQHLRNALLFSRRYIFAVHEVATKLSFMGLLSFGPQQLKEKDQVFIYIHHHTKIKNTSISQPAYLHISQNVEYSVKDYYLQTLGDVESYWLDLETICLHTPLGSFSSARGQSITIVNLFRKPQMIEASRNKQFTEVTDDGLVPGDGLGAAGLDSALFSHLKRNWSWPSMSNPLQKRGTTKKQKQESETSVGKSYMQYLLETSAKDPSAERRKRLQRLNKKTCLITSSEEIKGEGNTNLVDVTSLGNEPRQHIRRRKRKWNEKKPTENGSEAPTSKRRRKPDIVVRTINRKQWKKRKPYYDDKDKAALKHMSKMRVDWSPQEDSFLLLCKVASCFLNPTLKAMAVPFTLIRDLLCKKCPDVSKNKTSRACQRRLRYMMLNPTTVSNVSVFLGEIQQDKALVQQFQKPKPPISNEKVWEDMFTTVLEKFLTKFTMGASDRCKKITLPNSLKEFQENYKVNISGKLANSKSHHTGPQSIDDIYSNVVFSLIIASFCTVGDKTNWSYTLYKLYQQYPENLLRAVIARLRSEHLITKRRDLGKRIMQVVPLSSLPYRLSVTFEISLQTRYQMSIYDEAYELTMKLIENSTLIPGIELDGGIHPGYCAAVISFLALHKLNFDIQIPDQIILFDSSLSEEQCSQFVERVKQLQPIGDGTFSTDLAKTIMSERSHDSNEPEQLSKQACLEQKRCGEESKLPLTCDGTKVDSHDKELVIGCESDHSYCSASGCKESNQPLCTETDSAISSSIHIELPTSSKASRLALYMLRQEFTQTPTERAQHAQDFFVINSCRIHCRLADKIPSEEYKSSCFVYSEEEDPCLVNTMCDSLSPKNKYAETFLSLQKTKFHDIIQSQKKLIPSCAFTNVADNVEMAYAGCSSVVAEEGKKILCFINDNKELGATHSEIWYIFQNLSGEIKLNEHLSLMVVHNVIIRVGVTCFRYVGITFGKPWILSSFVVPREWRALASEIAYEESMEKTQCKGNLLKESGSSVKNIQPTAEEQYALPPSTMNITKPPKLVDKEPDKIEMHENKISCSGMSEPSVELSGPKINENEKEENKLVKTLPKRIKVKSFSNEKAQCINTESWQQVNFIGRLWHKPDGSLNRPILQKLLTSVLGYVLTYPGTTEKNIVEHFSKILQPVQTLELLELLEEAVCIRKFFVRVSSKPSLFSNLIPVKMVSDVNVNDFAHYEPAVDSVLKIGQFLDCLMKNR